MVDLSRQKIDTTQYLLGEGWLERGGRGFIVAPSGIGKTVFVAQAGFLWSVGKPAFGLEPYNGKPLKVILVQAENPKNKTIRTSWMWSHLGFNGGEAKLCQENFYHLPCNDITDNDFVNMLRGLCEDVRPDLLLIDPFNSYTSGSPSDEEKVKQFLRKELNPLLTERNIGCLIVHHTPKTNNSKTDEYSSVDFRYRMSGSAELTNWARCVLTVEPTNEERVFEFRIAKAYDESGWTEPTFYFVHTRRNGGVMFWSEATAEQVRKAKGALRNPQDIVKFLRPTTPMTTEQVITMAKADGWKDVEVKHALKSCENPDPLMAMISGEPLKQTVFNVKLRKPNSKPTDGWQSEPSDEDIAAIVFEAIPANDGIKPSDLESSLYAKVGLTKAETQQALIELEYGSKVKLYSGEGSTKAATYVIRADCEIEWKRLTPSLWLSCWVSLWDYQNPKLKLKPNMIQTREGGGYRFC
jgi:AAA domain